MVDVSLSGYIFTRLPCSWNISSYHTPTCVISIIYQNLKWDSLVRG